MNEQTRPLLPAILLIILAAILATAAAVLLLTGPSELEPSDKAVAVIPTLSAPPPALPISETPTASTSPRPTWTLQPSRTPTTTPSPTLTSTATRARVPTLTPARPYRLNERYRFNPMTAELMDQIARLVADYPDAKFRHAEDRLSQEYSAYFIYPALVFQEALLRFPESAQRTAWDWGLAYSLARLGSPQAVSLFQGFLLSALEQADLSLVDLPEWFHQNLPDLSLTIHELDLPASPGDFKLLEISEGHVVFLLHLEPGKAPVLYPLTPRFDFGPAEEMVYALLDLDGDETPELLLYLPTTPGHTVLAAPRLFSLGEMPPRSLPVQEDLAVDFRSAVGDIQVVEGESEPGTGFSLQAKIFPPCPVTVTRAYRWNGARAVPSPLTYAHYPAEDLISYCEPLLNLVEDFWEPAARLVVEDALLPFWPPETDPQGRPYPSDARDELRFRRAITLALSGQTSEALSALQELSLDPADPSSSWLKEADRFAQSLQDGSGLYRACREVPACSLHAALQHIASSQSEILPALAELRTAGAEIGSSGNFDFDQDGQPERWFTIRQRPDEALEFWLVASMPGGVKAVFVDTAERVDSIPYWSNAETYPGVFQIKSRQGYRLMRLESGYPYLERVAVEPVLSHYTYAVVTQVEQNLLNGQDPALALVELQALRQSGRFNCSTDQICDRYRYLLGLAAELSGDIFLARDAYIELWWENSTSPLAAAARLKLQFIPLPTPTEVASLTPTVTPTSLTPTVTPTSPASPSATLTPTP